MGTKHINEQIFYEGERKMRSSNYTPTIRRYTSSNSPLEQMISMMNHLVSPEYKSGMTEFDKAVDFIPRADIVEEKNNYRLDIDLPGMTKDEINISLEKDVLTISGERAVQEKPEEEKAYRNERKFGKFSRSFNLNKSIKSEKINASFSNGVLTLILPKQEEEKPKKITISTN